MDKLYTVHRYFNQACSDAGIQPEILVNEDDLKVILSPKPIRKIIEGLQKTAIANGIITKIRNSPYGSLTLISSNPSISVSSTLDMVENRFGKFYHSLNEAMDRADPVTNDLVKLILSRILQYRHVNTEGQIHQQAQNEWSNSGLARKVFPGRTGYKDLADAVCALHRKQNEDQATEQGYDKLANGWVGTGAAEVDDLADADHHARHKNWQPDKDEPPRAKDRFYENRKIDLKKSLDEALSGIAVPDGAAQPKVGVKMLEQALAAQTKSGTTLKDALKKQGITWHVAEPGSHVIVFKNKGGDEKWRVEPMTLSDKKVFEATMEALWSVALGKSPNAKELEREAAKQRAKELSDHQKEISGLVDQITGKYAPPAQEQEVENSNV